ncbi:MAG: hypothetical protein KJ749_11935, partial [Planctomycetes bacterium]|nr:hypothetical protein [Planctomycetota bacterium]
MSVTIPTVPRTRTLRSLRLLAAGCLAAVPLLSPVVTGGEQDEALSPREVEAVQLLRSLRD